jgi:hypothetical protein
MDHRTPKQKHTDRVINALLVVCIVTLGYQMARVFFETVR